MAIKEYYIGEDLTLKTDPGAKVAIGRDSTIFAEKVADSKGDVSINLDDIFEPGHYSQVISKDGKFISTEVICIKSPFINTSTKEQLRDMIRDLDKVIQYRLTSNEDAIQSMSINGKSFVYETLDTLMAARKKFVDQLSNLIQAENLRKGKSGIINIKARFNNPR
ncbi:hypothetical protein [Serratia ureilytica]|jgi:hypothetical protein|uniref:hypothetical protein n=1 Tax=Serratia ureilytica TaxID=300181 RepID=UPI0019D0A9CB|nr:hypothetical protein [Serratia ureilytica]MBN5214270.1 hypothetical protein [Serratia ureilytica]